jgi:NADPH:quinone reductase-like Zn-dependent oxidoreductase
MEELPGQERFGIKKQTFNVCLSPDSGRNRVAVFMSAYDPLRKSGLTAVPPKVSVVLAESQDRCFGLLITRECVMSVPSIMRAILLTGHGGPEKLQLDGGWPVPDIAPDEVLVKVGACGINNTDIWVREGAYGSADDPDEVASFGDSPLRFPLVQGADIAGVIVATGDDIKAPREGERVMVDFGIYSGAGEDVPSHDYIGSGRPGGFAEYVAIPAVNAHAVETNLTDAELATFCCAYVTGEHMLRRTRVTAGERVLVTGASGGVGSGVIQLCRAQGAIPYAVVGAGSMRSQQ